MEWHKQIKADLAEAKSRIAELEREKDLANMVADSAVAKIKELEAKLAEANHECYVRRAKIAALKQTAADLCAEADADKESAAGEVKA